MSRYSRNDRRAAPTAASMVGCGKVSGETHQDTETVRPETDRAEIARHQHRLAGALEVAAEGVGVVSDIHGDDRVPLTVHDQQAAGRELAEGTQLVDRECSATVDEDGQWPVEGRPGPIGSPDASRVRYEAKLVIPGFHDTQGLTGVHEIP